LPENPLADRNIRQRDIVNSEKLKTMVAAIIGVGAVGHQVARQLASMGVGRIILVDHDTVGVENLAAQGFREADLDLLKVDVVAEECQALNSEIEIEVHDRKFNRRVITNLGLDEDLIVFSCVDDMDARKRIHSDTMRAASLFIDGRMAAEVFSVYTADTKAAHEKYEESLFPSAEMFQASCTAKTTIYCANVISGMMIAQMTKFMRGIPTDNAMHLNILVGALTYDVEHEQPVEA